MIVCYFCINTENKPDLKSLEYLKGHRNNLRIIHDIAGEYKKLGICLLKLPDTTELEIIDENCKGKVYCMTVEIFNKWLQGSGEMPVTWNTLKVVLNKCMGRTELAKSMEIILLETESMHDSMFGWQWKHPNCSLDSHDQQEREFLSEWYPC